jgi:myo-inositol-1(or 4)-monophosphatase
MIPNLEQVEPVVRHAGTILLSYFRKHHLQTHRKQDSSIVTEADTASEKYIIGELKKIFPEASVLAEESGGGDRTDFCWVIDPLDGTTNFAHGLPYFCISVSLTFKGSPIFGIIYQPLTDELFYAEQGKGAFLNGENMHVSNLGELQKGMVLIGLPYAKSETFLHLLRDFELVAKKSYAVRHMGAAALDQAYVACGRVDAVFFEDLAWWDVAAGVIILKEAGALVTDFQGNEVVQGYKSYIAAGPKLYPELLKLVK